MNCPKCQQPAEPDAAFCGNCGQALQLVAAIPTNVPGVDNTPATAQQQPLPAYATAPQNPARQQLESKAMTGLVISVLALPGALIPVLGASLAIAGLVMSTTARGIHKTMRNTSVAFASLAIILSVGVYVWSYGQVNQASQQAQLPADQPTQQAMQAEDRTQAYATPCYNLAIASLDFSEVSEDSCKLWIRDTVNLADATDAYSIDAVIQRQINADNLAATGRELATDYLASSLPGFTITSQASGSFAGSPAYLINGRNTNGVTVQMALVLRPVGHGENIFVVVHAANGKQASVAALEANWTWK